jgi:hypothetical protein
MVATKHTTMGIFSDFLNLICGVTNHGMSSIIILKLCLVQSLVCQFLYWQPDNRLRESREVLSLMHQLAGRPPFLYPLEDSWYSFLLESESTPGP